MVLGASLERTSGWALRANAASEVPGYPEAPDPSPRNGAGVLGFVVQGCTDATGNSIRHTTVVSVPKIQK